MAKRVNPGYFSSRLVRMFIVCVLMVTSAQIVAADASVDMAKKPNSDILSLTEVESLLSSSTTTDAQQTLTARIESQDAKTLATLLILLHRKSEQIALQVEHGKMLHDKERLEQARALQDSATKMAELEAKHTKALLDKEEQIIELKRRLDELRAK